MRLTDRRKRVAFLARPMRPARKQPCPLDDGKWRVSAPAEPLSKVGRVVRGHSRLQSVTDRVLTDIDTCWHVAPFCMWRLDYGRGGCCSERQSAVVLGALVPCVSDWSRMVLRACRDALRPTGLAGRICPEMRSATRPVPRNSVPAIFFPAAAPLLAQQQDLRTRSFACAAA